MFDIKNSNHQLSQGATCKVFINSLPKAGTHLVEKLAKLHGFSPATPTFLAADTVVGNSRLKTIVKRFLRGNWFARNMVNIGIDVSAGLSEKEVRKILNAGSSQHSYLLGHAPHSDLLASLLQEQGIKVVLVIRDPRDVLVSWAHYIIGQEQHFAHSAHVGRHFEDRVRFILHGGYVRNELFVEGFPSVLRSLLGWLAESNVLIIKFEDLVGTEGGGSCSQQRTIVQQFAEFVGMESVGPDLMDSQLWGGTKTFRAGKIGGWQRELSEELQQEVNLCIGELLPLFGYETSRVNAVK